MESHWKQWPDEIRTTWRTSRGTAFAVYSPSGGLEEVSDGVEPSRTLTYVELPDDKALPYFVVETEVQPGDPGPVIVGVHAIQRHPDRPVRSSDLRGLRLEEAVAHAWQRASREPEPPSERGPANLLEVGPSMARPPLARLGGRLPKSTGERGGRVLQPATPGATPSSLWARERRRITPEVLDEVAQVYRDHRATGAPTKAVGEHFRIAPSTASLYVRLAREAGRDLGDPPGTPTPPKRQKEPDHGQHPEET